MITEEGRKFATKNLILNYQFVYVKQFWSECNFIFWFDQLLSNVKSLSKIVFSRDSFFDSLP